MQTNRSHDEACHHRSQPKPGRKALAAAIALAEKRCQQQGVRWTAQRERALKLLVEAGGPVKAYDLVPVFKDGAATAPPTIYRALDALVELGLVHRIASLNAYTACHLSEQAHAPSFLICDCCGAAEEFAPPAKALLATISGKTDFEPKTVAVEAYGRCGRCSE